MTGVGIPKRLAGPLTGRGLVRGLLVVGTLALLACARLKSSVDTSDDGINAYPTNYKTDILAAMHAYLNDPTGVRDAGVSVPVLKPIGRATHYVACLRFDAKQHGNTYAGPKEIAAIFLAGRFDQFVDVPKELCVGVTYEPFPELQALKR
jgi:hypothetical protein